ncbi:MAG TPA: Rieske 2Fe-2S domain-containing protein [Chitinophagaceae bacterium]|nr:Rieske 2Fe-2S domain-containing protein [Chitinophagaceae bacterium]
MTDKEYTWYKVADHLNEIEFGENNIGITEAKGKKICIARFNDKIFAFAYKCPHAGGILADGYIDALGNVVCPSHRYKYSLQNGRNVSGEGYYLKHWPVERRDDGVYVGLEKEGGLFGWLK